MPTYEYVCTACGHEFEAFQSISAEPLTACPSCGGSVQRKISGGAGLIFKGSGFYETDYKKTSASSNSTPKQAGTKEPPQKSTKKSVKKAS
jgi:putative FmdB family regulatory protein